MNSNWLNVGKECGSFLSSRLWGGGLRDDTKNGCVADDTILYRKSSFCAPFVLAGVAKRPIFPCQPVRLIFRVS